MTIYHPELLAASPLLRRESTMRQLTEQILDAALSPSTDGVRAQTEAREELYRLTEQLRVRTIMDLHVLQNLNLDRLAAGIGKTGPGVAYLRDTHGPDIYRTVVYEAGCFYWGQALARRSVIRDVIAIGDRPVPSVYLLDLLSDDELAAQDPEFWYTRLADMPLSAG